MAADAVLLCRKGEVLATGDASQLWTRVGRLPGAVAISFLSPGQGFAVASRPSCSAQVLQSVDGGAHWAPLSCLPGVKPQAMGA